jgi:TPP-dependent 2-oxoacid decarboxylase
MEKNVTLPTNDWIILRMTAQAMETSEYQIFVAAYLGWYGKKPDCHQVDKFFGTYLSRGEIPAFVRHFTRHYLNEHPEYLRHYSAQQKTQQLAERIALLLIVILVGLAILIF